MEFYYILDASAFINGFELESNNNFTVPEIVSEIKDFESKLRLETAIKEDKLTIVDVEEEFYRELERIISNSGDNLRLSIPDKRILALALQLRDKGLNIKLLSDDYSIQNVLKILKIPYGGIITEGIKTVYNWKKVCEGCKKEYPDDYPFEDCEICGSKIFKKRIRL